jgi:hypothetical protein
MKKLSSDRIWSGIVLILSWCRGRPSIAGMPVGSCWSRMSSSDVVVVLPCPLRRVSEEVDHASDMPDSLGAYRTPEPSPAALAFSTWVTALADPEGSRPRAKAPSYCNKGYTGFRRNAGFRMFSDSQEWLGRY